MAGAVDEVKARLDIIEVVSERVALKKAGKSFKGLCPFHAEKTPSFIVFPETGTWRCFGCGEGGDVFGFVMRSQNVDFKEALTLLAARAGVQLHPDHEQSRPSGDLEAKILAANEAAATYFRSMLAGPAGLHARAYLAGRGLSPESAEGFQLGYAPDLGSGLAHHLLQQHFEREVILQAGLAGENESGGLYDRFRGRLIFPIRDASGRLVGFGGRALAKEAQPKYLNTPQTALFDKGGSLYAVERAQQEIRRSRQAVIVEGYLDAIMAHQHGFRNVVASMGTALTDRQIGQLKRWAAELCFALDPDVAGQEATARGLEVAMEALDRTATPVPSWKGLVRYVYRLKTNIKIIALPRGLDPDEVIRHDEAEWRLLVQNAVPVQQFFLERVRRKHDLSTAEGKSAAVEEAMAVIAEIPDPVQQAHYVQRLAGLVGIEESILLQQVRRGRRRPGTRESLTAVGRATGTTEEQVEPRAGDRWVRPIVDAEGYCLALLLKNPSLMDIEPSVEVRHFQNPAYQEIFRRLAQYRGTGKGDADTSELVRELRRDLDELLRETLDRVLDLSIRHPLDFEEPLEKAYRTTVVTLLVGHLALRRQQLEAMVADAASSSDPAEHDRLRRAERDMTEEAHRLKRLGATVPLLRAVHKEVRHGG